ncbi:MAG TPA: Ig-like domain-containing protein, partial [Ilumatobacteraceae bacterium]|nr:Ig-like domain-containing protein [Ilumatobacteraceae bacterium]
MRVAGFIRAHVVRCAVTAFVVGSTVVGLPAPAAHAATPTFVQARANEVNGGTTNNLAFTNPNTAGNLIVVYAVWSNGGTVSINDSRGNTYASALPATRWNGNTWSAQVFYATNVASGANSVTATFGTAINSFGIIYIHEYSGVDKVNPLDVSKSAIGTSSAMNSGSATTTNANDLIFGAGASKSNVNQAGSGFTTRLSNYGNRTEDKRVTTTGSYNATATQNSNAWVMQMVAFKADAGVTDTTAPTVPTNLAATPASISQINLSWSASTDNVGVAGYRIFRNGVQVGTSTTTSFNDTGLTANTTYGYSVNAYDAAGNASAQTAVINATTLADTSSPTVPTGLTATAVSSTQVNLTWAASTDNVGVTGYDVFRDGVQLTTVGSTSYINTGLTADTTYSYTVRARDAAGNLSAQTPAVNVTTPPVDTVPPSVSMTAPASGSTVSGSITVSANATDNVAVTGVQFLLDGASLGAEDTSAPYSIAWNTTTAPNGLHTLTARARDAAGNSTTTSGAVTVTVSNTATPAGLAAGYPFDEGTGTTAADASGHTLTGTLINGAGWASGKYGTAVNLDGANDYVDLGNPAGLQITGSMTISAWVNSAVFPFDDAAIVSKRGTAGFQLDTTVDKGPRTIGFKLTTGTGADMFRYGATALQTNTWYHIAGV